MWELFLARSFLASLWNLSHASINSPQNRPEGLTPTDGHFTPRFQPKIPWFLL